LPIHPRRDILNRRMPRLRHQPLLSVLLSASGLLAQDDGWWAYRALQRPAVPVVRDAQWGRTPVDAFVRAGLAARGLTPAPMADRHTLLRRVTYDLTGLPPTPAEIAAFVGDGAADAWERVVDRLLASPQYGVKWARHWLDLVRYADTDGYERDRKKPFVWRYRDWVVDAFNADMPYTRFLTTQLAGDELPGATVADLVATGFYRLGLWDDEPTDAEQHRYDDLDSIADTTARVTMAVSMGCARCHDHKKDPLPQRDYHAFLAFFENVAPYDLRARTVPADGARERFEAELADYGARRERLARTLREAAAPLAVMSPHTMPRAGYDGEGLGATSVPDAFGGPAGVVHGQVVAVAGRRGQAMRFDGDDHVQLPRLVEDSFSVSFWLRSTTAGGGKPTDAQWYAGTGLVDGEVVAADWGIGWLADGRVIAGVGGPDTSLVSGPGQHDGEWHHVAFTRDAGIGRIALFVDGTLVGEAVASTQPLTAPPDLAVGRARPGGRGFQGDLDELQFFDRALTTAQVVALTLDLTLGVDAPAAIARSAAAGGDDGASAFAEFAALRRPTAATVEVLAVEESGAEPPPSFVRLRGNVHARGAQVEPGFPTMLQPPAPAIDAAVGGGRSSGRRTALARWITDPAHPLTWRVIANRLWQHHFGRGLVRSSNDFGRLGDRPTHPELLDWLACEVVARGGSLKAMHRLLLTSATYTMGSGPSPAASAVDPQNDTFWRVDRRRVTAEELRDSMLATAGGIDLSLGGPSVFPPLPAAVLATASRPEDAWGEATPAEASRRSLYVHQKRSLQEPLLAVFDQADTDNSCPVRFATVQPTQALVLWNGDFANAQARRFADRLLAAPGDLRARLALGLELATQRPAQATDVDRLLALAADLRTSFGRSEALALQRCCLVLLNANAFAYLD
jgi:hypothetical protein